MTKQIKLIKKYLYKVKYFINVDSTGDIMVDYFDEEDFKWLKGSNAFQIVSIEKVNGEIS